MKTAIRQLIECMENAFLENQLNSSSDVLILCHSFLETEEEQLETSYHKGYDDHYKGEYEKESYYKETFKS